MACLASFLRPLGFSSLPVQDRVSLAALGVGHPTIIFAAAQKLQTVKAQKGKHPHLPLPCLIHYLLATWIWVGMQMCLFMTIGFARHSLHCNSLSDLLPVDLLALSRSDIPISLYRRMALGELPRSHRSPAAATVGERPDAGHGRAIGPFRCEISDMYWDSQAFSCVDAGKCAANVAYMPGLLERADMTYWQRWRGGQQSFAPPCWHLCLVVSWADGGSCWYCHHC